MSANVAVTKKNLLKGLWDNAGMLVVFVVMFVAISIFVPYFLTWRNMVGLALSVSMVGMVSSTMLFCLASGDFDLSVEAIVAFAGVTAAVLINQTGSIMIGVAGAVVSGVLIGFINGFIIARLRINALITTYAMQQIVRGVGFIVSAGGFSASAAAPSSESRYRSSSRYSFSSCSEFFSTGRPTDATPSPSAATRKPRGSRVSASTRSR